MLNLLPTFHQYAVAGTGALTLIVTLVQPSHAVGFDSLYELQETTLPDGMSIVDITIDGRQPRHPETFVEDIDGDGLPEFIAFPGDDLSGQCKPLLIALSTVRGNDDIDSSDTRYITVPDANGTVPEDSFCSEIETFETIGDMDGDGYNEFALYSQGTYVLQNLKKTSGEVRLGDLNGINGFQIQNALLRRDVGDLDGDGLDELSVTEFNTERFDLGNEYLVRGRTGIRDVAILPEENSEGELLATIYNGADNFTLVLPAGDLNGDGLDDLLIHQSDNLNIVYGAVDLQIQGNILSDPESPVVGEGCGFFRCPVLTGFDFDGDGFNDIAMTFGPNRDDRSAIIYGGPDGLPAGKVLAEIPTDRVTVLTGDPWLFSGFTDIFGDVNSDGHDDIYFSSQRDTVVLLATPGRRLAEIDTNSLDGSNGFRLAADQTQVSDTFRPFINGRVLMADMNGDSIDDYVDGQLVVDGVNDASIGRAPLGLLVRQGPESADLFWTVLDNVRDVAGFKVTVGDQVLVELPATSRNVRVEGDTRQQGLDIRIASMDADDQELGSLTRRIQTFGEGFGMRGEVYGPNLIELFWDAPADDYLLWRDGEVYSRVNGQSYLDRDVEPGKLHEYFITDDVLTGGDATADYLNFLEGLQRRTNAVTIGPSGSSEPVDPETPPGSPGGSGQRPDVPADLSGTVYSPTALELFWSRVTSTGIERYDVYRDGEKIASVPGPSWFDSSLKPSST